MANDKSGFTPLEWRPQLAVGHEKIDEDHKRLIELINKVQSLFVTHASMGVLTLALDALHDYTRDHFAREESVMRKIDYPHFHKHAQAHETLVRRLNDLTEKILLAHSQQTSADSLPKENKEALLQLLRDWLIHHVIQEDLKMRDYLLGAAV